jgi:hypothetical protein
MIRSLLLCTLTLLCLFPVTDLFTARAKKWIVDHAAARPDQPFFIYLACDTPHARLPNPPCPCPDRTPPR